MYLNIKSKIENSVRINIPCIFALLFIFGFLTLYDTSFSQIKFSGHMFGDYYYIAKNHNDNIEGENGFWFRRIFFTGDSKLNDKFSVRFRTEFKRPGDFQKKADVTPILKDAYLKWTRKNHSIIFGLSQTPTFAEIEKVWGYRSVEKTPLDLQKFATSKDFGITFKGALDSGKKLSYNFMFANGSGTSSETNKGKKILFSLTAKTDAGLILEGYFDWNDRSGGKRWYTLQGFLGYRNETFRTGFQFARQARRIGPSPEDEYLEIFSIFMIRQISKKMWTFTRIDRNFDPNPDGNKISYIPFDPNSSSNFFIAGLDFCPIEEVHIMPNVEIIIYDALNDGEKPDSDIIPRMTMYYKF